MLLANSLIPISSYSSQSQQIQGGGFLNVVAYVAFIQDWGWYLLVVEYYLGGKKKFLDEKCHIYFVILFVFPFAPLFWLLG